MSGGRSSAKRPRQEDEVDTRRNVHKCLKSNQHATEVRDAAVITKRKSLQEGNIHVGDPAPQFTCAAVIGSKFEEVSLHDYHGKFVVILFYPLDFTYVCPTEILCFAERINEFRSIGCEVLGVSTDSKFTHLAWTQTSAEDGGIGPIPYPLLSDKSLSVSRKYGVLNEADGVAYRTLVIIDDNCVIREIMANDDRVGRSVDETLRLIQALKHVDEHGQVCPAGWKPGDKAIDPNKMEMDVSKE